MLSTYDKVHSKKPMVTFKLIKITALIDKLLGPSKKFSQAIINKIKQGQLTKAPRTNKHTKKNIIIQVLSPKT